MNNLGGLIKIWNDATLKPRRNTSIPVRACHETSTDIGHALYNDISTGHTLHVYQQYRKVRKVEVIRSFHPHSQLALVCERS